MSDSNQAQLEKLRKSIAALEAQRSILGDEALEPALVALRQQIATLEAQAAPPEPTLPTPSSDDRRVVTILFSDIVGSTALAEKLDPEEWTDIIKPAFDSLIPPIYDRGGTVARLMGDAILAFFGAPEAHEDDAERAILAGLAIVKNIRAYSERLKAERGIDLQVRVGINTGLVVVGNIGSNLKSEYTAMGDAINLAARLQSAAPPGNILISYDTYRYVRGVFDVTPQPPLTVKGKSEPVKTYVVQRARVHPFHVALRGVAGIQTRTIGREAEVAKLQAAYLDAHENRRVVWSQLIGEPGVGKSRVLSDLTEWLELRPEETTVLRARAFLGDSGNAFALIRRMWFDRFQISEDAHVATAEANWVRGFRQLSGIVDEEPAHALGLLAGLTFEGSRHLGAMRDDPRQVRGRAFVVSRELIRKLRARGPLVLLLEDVHWADASSWEYLSEVFLDQQPAAHGLFVLGTARPEWTSHELLSSQTVASYVPIQLSPLGAEASRELTFELLRRVEGVPDEVVQSIVERAEGVPYFAEELVNLFVDRGLIDQSREPWRFIPERYQSLPLPATLQHLLHTRLLALPEKERVCLQRGAIFGRHFWEGGLKALGVKEPNILLNPLEPRGFVESQNESSFQSQSEWSFHHALLRDVSYESVLKRDRQWLHKEVATWLETQATEAGRVDEFAAALGEHAEHAGQSHAAAGWYERAGDHALAQGATREAGRFCDRALRLLPATELEQRWRLLLKREEIQGILGEVEARRADVDALLKHAQESGEDVKLAESFHRHAYLLVYSNDYTGCLSACDQAVGAARRGGDRRLEMLCLSLQVPALVRSGQIKKARNTAREALDASHELNDKSALLIALPRIGVYFFETGDLATYIELMSEQIQIARELGDRLAEAIGLSNIGESYARLGLYRQARAHLEQAKAAAEAIGARRFRALAVDNLGSALLQMGHLRKAEEPLQEAQREFHAMQDLRTEERVKLELALLQEQAGDFVGAERVYLSAREKLEEMGLGDGVGEANAGLARCALAQGKLPEARQYADEAAGFLNQEGATAENPFRIYRTCAEVWLALGEMEAARGLVREGWHELQTRAQRLNNPEWRQSFLDNVPDNSAVTQLAQRLEVDGSFLKDLQAAAGEVMQTMKEVSPVTI